MAKKVVYIFIFSLILVPIYAADPGSDFEEEKERENLANILDSGFDTDNDSEEDKVREGLSLDSDSDLKEGEDISDDDDDNPILDQLTEEEEDELLGILTKDRKRAATEREVDSALNTIFTAVAAAWDDPNLSNPEKVQEMSNAVAELDNLAHRYPEKSSEIREIVGRLVRKFGPLFLEEDLHSGAEYLGAQLQRLKDYFSKLKDYFTWK